MRPADARFTEDVKDEIGWLIQTFPLYSGQNAPDPSMRGQMKDTEETFRVRNNWLDASPEEREQMLKIGLYEIVMTTVTQVLKEVLGAPKQPLPTFKHYHKVGALLMSVGFRDAFNRWITESRGYNKDRQHQKERMFDLLDQTLDSMDLSNSCRRDFCLTDDFYYTLRGYNRFQIKPPPRSHHTRGRRTKQPPPLRKKTAIKGDGQQRWGQNAQRRSLRN